MDVFSISSVELKVSVMVFKAGVPAAVEDARMTAGRVSMLEDRSIRSCPSVYSGPEEVKIFSGAGMVSV